jgi:bisphosphoglycerate-independent phosphoglycerate mutase (AlkP superfamily)
MDFIEPGFSVVLGGVLEQVHQSAANQWLKAEYQWFQVNGKQARDAFKNVFTNYKKYIDPAKQQGHLIKTNFSYDKMKELVGVILDKNLPEFATEMKLNLPSLGTPQLTTPQLK